MNDFLKSVIEEEDAIDDEAGKIKDRIALLEEEITRLKNNDVFFYRQRKYCKFSDGYSCTFTGECTHKENVKGYINIFGIRCFVENHARSEVKEMKQE